MKKYKTLIKISGVLLIIGLMLYLIGFAMGGVVSGISFTNEGFIVSTPNGYYGKDPYASEIDKWQTKEIALDSFSSLDIKVDYSNVNIAFSDHYGVSLREDFRNPFILENQNGLLKIRQKSSSSFSQGTFMISLFGMSPGVSTFSDNSDAFLTVYLPQGTPLSSLSVRNSTGNIDIAGGSFTDLSLNADFGDISLADFTSSSAKVQADTGDIILQNFSSGFLDAYTDFGSITLTDAQTEEDWLLSTSTGSISINQVEAADLTLKTDFGDVSAKELSCDFLSLKMNTGSGTLQLNDFFDLDLFSDFGDIKLTVPAPSAQYRFDLATDFGNISIDRKDMGAKYSSIEEDGSKSPIKVTCSTGSIYVEGIN